VKVDLARQEITAPSGTLHRFEVDPFRKQCLLEGLDEISFTLGHDADIAAFERRQAQELGWL
jgi:3-isopropylmalate/(R)-2-methylmalate dehydratase small subunit